MGNKYIGKQLYCKYVYTSIWYTYAHMYVHVYDGILQQSF